MSETEIRRYRFGPLERRGLIGSLRATQVIPMAASLAAAVVLMRTLPSGAGLFAALVLFLAVASFCFWPLNGRSAEEWLPIAAAHRGAGCRDGTGGSRPPPLRAFARTTPGVPSR